MKIAIWGLGVSGLGALEYLSQEKKHEIFIINQGDKATWLTDEILSYIEARNCYQQSEVEAKPNFFDLIILSPGIDPRIQALKAFKNVKKICDIEYVSTFIEKPIIAVTGTNGKTSTVTMIGECLESSGANVFVGGNIGQSPFKAMANLDNIDYFVFELSSFQLELMDSFHPLVSVILNISPSHMERYDSYEEYYNAKLTIFQNQKADDYILLDSEILPVESSADIIEIKALQGFDFSSSKLTGTHMYKNLYVVYKIMNILNIKNSKKLMQEFIKQFSGVQFRLEFIKSVQKTDFYNDAKSTNTASTIAAIESFPNKKVALILGGKLRDDTQDFLSPLKENQNITLYLFGDSREYLRQQLGNDFKIVMAEKLDDLLELSDLSEFEVVLFSPGFPSFDQYKNYIARGDHFNSIVNNLL